MFIFLNVDGVLNNDKDFFNHNINNLLIFECGVHLNKKCLENLVVLMSIFKNAKIIITSEWRNTELYRSILELTLKYYNINIYSYVDINDEIKSDTKFFRLFNIKKFIKTHNIHYDNIIVLDSLHLVGLYNYIYINSEYGLTAKHINKILDLFSIPRKIK